eukprot:g3338.t1 g3338   contig12:1877940-1879229(-)
MAFNKMFVMLPVMLAARKLDGEDPQIVFLLRCLYGAVQTVAILIVLFVYTKAAAAAADPVNNVKIYVPPPPQPFADPNAKKTYQEKTLASNLLTTAKGLVTSTFFGVIMTVGLHIWKGMIVGLAIQSIMAPFNLFENPLIKTVFVGGGLTDLKEKKIFGEKTRDEITADDEVTDENGNMIVLSKNKEIKDKKKGSKKETKTFEDTMLDTWDMGAEANISEFMTVLNKGNINSSTKENGWTPIMIMCGLGAKGVPGGLRQMKELNANPAIVDKEGWNALHWAAFHGSADAAKVLLDKKTFDGIALGLHTVLDKEGKTPLTHAKDEGNNDVAKVIEEAESNASGDSAGVDEGLRKRK